GTRGNFGNGIEPAFVDLLGAAGVVEFHDQIGFVDFEISGRIVKRKVAVFTDSNEGEVNRCGGQRLPYRANNLGRILLAIEQVIPANARLANEALHQIFAETGRVADREANVLVEVKHFDAVPVDARSCGQELQKVELRRAGCGDDARDLGLRQNALKGLGG